MRSKKQNNFHKLQKKTKKNIQRSCNVYINTSSQTHENLFKKRTLCVMKWFKNASVLLWLIAGVYDKKITVLKNYTLHKKNVQDKAYQI